MRRLGKGLLLAATLGLAGCPAAHDNYPTRSCMLQSDCYEGETCDQNNNLCVTNAAPDMSVASSPQDQGPATGDDQ